MSRAPRSGAAKRDWGSDDSLTNIMHVDMDAFFVSVELLERPQLRGTPVAVGGMERGVISAASYEARRFGVNSAMPVARAKRLCPALTIIPPSHGKYSAVSRRIMAILADVTPKVEQLSVDEAFLDVGGARKAVGSPTEIAHLIRARIREQEGVPASVGIAATKHVAKIASAHAKPDGVLLVPESATLEFLHSLPVGVLWGVGEKMRAKLEYYGIHSVGELAALGEARLARMVGSAAGHSLYALAMGIDPRAVVTHREEKSMGKEQTFFDLLDPSAANAVLLEQSHEIARRLRSASVRAWTVGIKVRFEDFTTVSRSVTFGAPTDLGAEIYRAATHLLAEVPSRGGFRLLGVRAEHLDDGGAGFQLRIDDDGRSRRAESAVDEVLKKFGSGAAGRGSLVKKDAPGVPQL
ncbi:DNA polymerase-4 [Arcanobacterium wilhelmae]|uniref:DNA polymerase IV n=1 Tax=Arcanobacterium wilhelmae TaxID=1803177 RepID=A0ABT9N989_9ACTO|nr:DNA polymerase IV [Arcanobacterium wilhelmae]MDP9800260.1 DNA polymerase-4 [Arcanobacterium wilhelmae]WFN89699.1 DNA polymerase IV [Arcanobacterium wilhelmae]